MCALVCHLAGFFAYAALPKATMHVHVLKAFGMMNMRVGMHTRMLYCTARQLEVIYGRCVSSCAKAWGQCVIYTANVPGMEEGFGLVVGPSSTGRLIPKETRLHNSLQDGMQRASVRFYGCPVKRECFKQLP